MKISSSAYFGVESLVRLAAHNAGRPCTTESLARSISRSVSYTEHLMAQLREVGLVKVKHGRGGGYYLNKPPDRITVADVFRVFDEPRTLEGRPFAPQALTDLEIDELHGTELLWEALKSYILLFLAGISLADVAPDNDGALPDHVATMREAPARATRISSRFIDGIDRASPAYRHRSGGNKEQW